MNKDINKRDSESNIIMKNELKNAKKSNMINKNETKSNTTNDKQESKNELKHGNKHEEKSIKKLRIISLIIWAISLIASICLILLINKLNVIPEKYFSLIIAGLAVIEIIPLLIILLKKKGKVLVSIIDIILIVLIIVETLVSIKINKVQNFMESNLNKNYNTSYYSVIVSASSPINSVDDLSGKDVHYFSSEDNDNKQKLVDKINSTISNANLIEETDNISALTSVIKDENYALAISSSMIDFMNTIDGSYESKIKTITTIELKTLKDNTDSTNNTDYANIDITKEPFYIYFSGIDTRSGGLPTTCLSDSNIIVAVNPNSKKILLVHIPRDYFVLVHGTTGQKDKFTHAGLRGGIELSKATLEDIFDMKFPYYARANFNAISNLVDAIGGINIYNDQDHTIHTNYKGYSFAAGWNYNVKGEKALAFAHERYSYSTGDRHRGENQEQVITRIIDKLSSSKELLTHYEDIMNAMNGTFETNISYDQISNFIKMQINDMAKWSVETYNVNGSDGMEYTASFPTQKSYVMYPDYSTVNEAKKKINDVLGK